MVVVVVMIAKITFLIQSSNHLLPTVNKLVCNNPTRARQNNMAIVHILWINRFSRSVSRPMRDPFLLLGDVLHISTC